MQSAKIGSVGYNNCLKVHVSGGGLHLAMSPLPMLGHPPLLIPWGELEFVRTTRRWRDHFVVLAVGQPPVNTISLPSHILPPLG